MPFTGIGIGLWGNYGPGAGDPALVLNFDLSEAPLDAAIVFNRDSVAYTLNDFLLFEEVAIDEPRFPPDPFVDLSHGLLMEPSASNAVLNSEHWIPTTSAWSQVNLGAELSNVDTAPDGEATADALATNTATSIHFIRQSVAKPTTPLTYAFSCFIKQHTVGVTTPYAYVTLYDGSSGEVGGRVNLVTGAVDQLIQAGTFVRLAFFALPGPDGWWRVSVAGVSTSTAVIAPTVHIGDDSQTVYTTSYTGVPAYNIIKVWGGQLEVNVAFNSSYVKTEGSIATRQPETAIVDLTGLLDTTNTVVIEAHTYLATARILCQLDDDGVANRVTIERRSNMELHVLVRNGALTQADLNLGVVSAVSAFKIAVRFGPNSFAASLNGGAVVTDTSGTMPTVDTLRIGHDTNGNQWGSIIKSVMLFDEGKTNDYLQAVSS